MKNILVFPHDKIINENIFFEINGFGNNFKQDFIQKQIELKKHPISLESYKQSFDIAMTNLKFGNSYLLNLTKPTKIEINLSLKDIFIFSRAKYKLFYNNKFVVFSPETFIKINDGIISSYPMKGTIDADIKDAENVILNNKKEFAEHSTIVDLIRNDLSKVAKNVEVEKFRYIDKIETNNKTLLQVSSKIVGQLPNNYAENIGSILQSLLPAGSISGAPKKKTIEIIKDAEKYERPVYTGIFGFFDGVNLDSGVMIRYVEKINNDLYFKSGGGITAYSDLHSEYNELIDKVYVPITRNN